MSELVAWMLEQYPAARLLTEDTCIILRPLTLGRWRVSRADRWSMLDGY